MLAAVIAEKIFRDAENSIKKAEDVNLIELRADYIKDFELGKFKKLIVNCKKPLIATNRKKDEGGCFKGNENERVQILKKALEFGAEYIDIEYSSGDNTIIELTKNKKNSKVIVSYHEFEGTPGNIEKIYNNIKKLSPDFIKIVTNANSVTDNFRIFDLIKSSNKENRKIIAFCMGSYGEFSRVLSLILGSRVTYASISREKASANGQLTADEMVNHYRIKKLNENTKIAGLIGNPVKHSWSHIMHNAAFGKMNFNAVYLKFRVDKLREFIEYFKWLNILGFSVTIPHKIEVMNYLDEVDEKARAIGAVNTIVVKNKRLIGHNTDCDGAILALKAKTGLKGKNIAVLGAGGSSRALAYGLKKENADVIILNRTIEKAKVVAEDFNCSYGPLDDLKNTDYDVLVNTTPVGMYPDIGSSPVPPKLIKKGSVVFDIVFNPYETKLLKEAKNKGCTTISGFEMLIKGAALQFKLWTNRNAPEQLMRSKVMECLKNACN